MRRSLLSVERLLGEVSKVFAMFRRPVDHILEIKGCFSLPGKKWDRRKRRCSEEETSLLGLIRGARSDDGD